MTVNRLLQSLPTLQSIDVFISYVSNQVARGADFYSCLALESKAGTESIFFWPSPGDGPDALIKTAVALTVATRAHRVFVGRYADLAKNTADDKQLGKHQAVFFESNSERSHPFVFCKFDLTAAGWHMGKVEAINEPDTFKSIALSDLHQDIAAGSKDQAYVLRARASLEKWRDDVEWGWKRYDIMQ
jgi:hypothetical protein